MILSELKSPEIENLDKAKLMVVIPIGAVEAHGPHLPVSTDSIIIEHLAEKICENSDNAILAPTISYTYNLINYDYPGTVSIQPEHFAHYLEDVIKSFVHHGFENFFLYSSHGVNDVPVKLAIMNLLQYYSSSFAKEGRGEFSSNPSSPPFKKGRDGEDTFYPKIAFKTWWDLAKVRSRHAERLETSLMLAINPELVDMDKAIDCKPENPWHWFPSRKKYNPDTYGVNGEATKASVEEGRKLVERIVEKGKEFVRDAIKE